MTRTTSCKRYRQARAGLALLLLGAVLALPAAARQAIPQVEIIGSAPLAGSGQPKDQFAAPVQTAGSEAIARSGAIELGDFMNRRMGAVHVNDMQGNPFQMDVSYRGYSASPLLGTAQGLSVYLDGVRMNRPFGDVVSWDTIALAALARVTLMPGSNPLFGLNTLGGALALQTKDGISAPGTVLEAGAGANRRRSLQIEHGGANAAGLHWYLMGKRFAEDGWRVASPSDVRQLFGKLGWRSAASELALSLMHADNALTGNGLQEQNLLARQRNSVYTLPDETANRSTLLSLAASHSIDASLDFAGNLYVRRIRSSSFNGDLNEAALDQALYQPDATERAVLAAAGYQGVPASGATAATTPFPFWRCIAQVLLADHAAEQCNGLLNRTSSVERNHGLSGQLNWLGTLAGQSNRLLAGLAYDASDSHFRQSSQLGYLNADRSITAVDAFADGASGGSIDGEPFDNRVDLRGKVHTWSVFASDTVSVGPGERLHLTLAGRYNATTVDNRDALHSDDDSASLSGHHRFARFNPALGLTWKPAASTTVYAGYGESSRAPTAIELGCANPQQPCKLPNAMAGDPPLRQVRTATLELGVRGSAGPGLRWHAGLFNARNRDDLLFVADDQAGYGYFRNFGATRRRGMEAGIDGRSGQLAYGARYSWLDATYQSAETVNGSSNSSNSSNSSISSNSSNNSNGGNDGSAAGAPGTDGSIAISPGDRIPLVPRHTLKLFAELALAPAIDIDADLLAVAGAPARGNENNGHRSDGVFYLGPGRSAGYVLVNLGASVRLSTRWQLLARISNLFDTRYNSAAQLGPTGFDSQGNYLARPFAGNSAALRHATFYAPGTPRLAWLGLRYTIGR